jgi:hypothetical protein
VLVIAPDVNEANEMEVIVREPSFASGSCVDSGLRVHSKVPVEALAQLNTLEDRAALIASSFWLGRSKRMEREERLHHCLGVGHWVVEVNMDKEMTSSDVQGK